MLRIALPVSGRKSRDLNQCSLTPKPMLQMTARFCSQAVIGPGVLTCPFSPWSALMQGVSVWARNSPCPGLGFLSSKNRLHLMAFVINVKCQGNIRHTRNVYVPSTVSIDAHPSLLPGLLWTLAWLPLDTPVAASGP